MLRTPSSKDIRAALEQAYRAPARQPVTRKRRRMWALAGAVLLIVVAVLVAIFATRPLALEGPLPSLQDVPKPTFALTR